ncbi:MAG: ABC transporter substrate-binding protein [Rhodospirillales bacterium]|nr:ABC transporter substrate-binding protein [Rhodospirillales bacterium]
MESNVTDRGGFVNGLLRCAMVVAVGFAFHGNASAADPKPGETVNIGFLGALSGPDAGWGLPGLTGNQMFVDEMNAGGGLDVCGSKYPLKMFTFDDEAIGSKALQGAKQLVLEHDVKFISAIGGNPADAVHPYLTQKKVVYASLISTDIKPDRPYLIAGGDVTPRIDMMRPLYHKMRNPNLKRWAVLSQDDTIGQTSQAWEVGSAMADGWDVVYDKHYAMDVTDFAPIVTAVLATNPDVVSLNLSYPDFVVQIIEQLYIQGFKGLVSANYLDTESILTKVPKEYIEGAVDSFPLFDDPWWGEGSFQHNFNAAWMKRYGPGGPEDVKRGITGIDWDHVIMLRVWAKGVQLACSFDPDKVLAALRKEPQVETILGPGPMRGKEMWGIDNMISPPIPFNEVRDGVKRVQAQINFENWFETRKDKIISVVRSKGQMWDQRK